MAAALAFYRRLGLDIAGRRRPSRTWRSRCPAACGCLRHHRHDPLVRPGLAAADRRSRVSLAFRCADPAEVDRVYADLVGAGYHGHLAAVGRVLGAALRGAPRPRRQRRRPVRRAALIRRRSPADGTGALGQQARSVRRPARGPPGERWAWSAYPAARRRRPGPRRSGPARRRGRSAGSGPASSDRTRRRCRQRRCSCRGSARPRRRWRRPGRRPAATARPRAVTGSGAGATGPRHARSSAAGWSADRPRSHARHPGRRPDPVQRNAGVAQLVGRHARARPGPNRR